MGGGFFLAVKGEWEVGFVGLGGLEMEGERGEGGRGGRREGGRKKYK